MFLKTKISEIFHNLQLRFFNTTTMSGRASKLVQFHSGGDDYCPTKECEGLSDCVGNNPADGIVVAWRDDVKRTAAPGEKRFYSLLLDEDTGEPKRDTTTGEMLVAAEIHLKNDGNIVIKNASNGSSEELPVLNITVVGDCNLEAENITAECENATLDCDKATITATTSVDVLSPVTNLGEGGEKIARLGDEVTITIPSGSSAGTYTGTITSSGTNTSI
jgi:hypothetical protein